MEIQFTTINHASRKKLGLTRMEYELADTIYHLSNHTGSSYPGWCYAPRKTLQEILEVSNRQIYKMLKILQDKDLIEEHPITKHLKTKIAWYNNVIINNTAKNAVGMQKMQSPTAKNAVPINKVDNDKDNDIETYVSTFNSFFHKSHRATKPVARLLSLRLKTFSLKEILSALQKASADPFYQGQNDRGWRPAPEFFIRNDSQIDKFMNHAYKPAVNQNSNETNFIKNLGFKEMN